MVGWRWTVGLISVAQSVYGLALILWTAPHPIGVLGGLLPLLPGVVGLAALSIAFLRYIAIAANGLLAIMMGNMAQLALMGLVTGGPDGPGQMAFLLAQTAPLAAATLVSLVGLWKITHQAPSHPPTGPE